MAAWAPSLPLEGRVAGQGPAEWGRFGSARRPYRAASMFGQPHPARCASHPPLKGEGFPGGVA
jgi:hypothetical protein